MLKFLLLASALSSKCLSLPWDHEFTSSQLAAEDIKGLFHEWRLHQTKVYGSVAEEMRRFGIFAENMERIAEGNDEYHAGKRGFLMRMNLFGLGDLNDEERRQAINGDLEEEEDLGDFEIADGSAQLKTGDENKEQILGNSHFDWRDKGKVTSVGMQNGCNSCWAFAAVASMECNQAIDSGNSPYSMSEQQCVDCDPNSSGCGGGLTPNAWKYVISAGGICKESAYPYGGGAKECKDSSCTKRWKPNGYTVVTKSSSALQSAVSGHCVALRLEGNQFGFYYYSQGIFDGLCGTTCNHAVLATGYGAMGDYEYWIIKNSWGTSWGQQGYIYLCKNCGKNGSMGQCGILRFSPQFAKY